MNKSQGGPPRGAQAPVPQGISTSPQRVNAITFYTTDGEVRFDRGIFQMQILPSGMHLLRFEGSDGSDVTFVLGGNCYGHALDRAQIEELT